MIEDFKELIYPTPFQSDQFQSDQSRGRMLPLPGPSSAWTAEGVIQALEPLTTELRRARLRQVLSQRLGALTVVLDDTHKPHNRSAVIRSCEAFGIQRAHMLKPKFTHHSKPLAISKLISKGSHNWIDLVEHQSAESVVAELKASGHSLLVTHPQGQLRPADLSQIPKLALILGNEHLGIRAELNQAADATVAIPMSGFVESLNVSVTAAILLQAAATGRSGDLKPEEMENIYARWLRISVPRADEVLSSFPPC